MVYRADWCNINNYKILPAESQGERNGFVLQFVVRQKEFLQLAQSPNIRRESIEEVISQRESFHIGTFEEFSG